MKNTFLFFTVAIVTHMYLNIQNIFALTQDDLHIKKINFRDKEGNITSSVEPLQAYTWGEASISIEKLIFTSTEEILMRLYIVIAVWVMIYVWFLFLTAEWKTEQFSKAWKAAIYAIIWLAVVPLAYVLVKIATWINL